MIYWNGQTVHKLEEDREAGTIDRIEAKYSDNEDRNQCKEDDDIIIKTVKIVKHDSCKFEIGKFVDGDEDKSCDDDETGVRASSHQMDMFREKWDNMVV